MKCLKSKETTMLHEQLNRLKEEMKKLNMKHKSGHTGTAAAAVPTVAAASAPRLASKGALDKGEITRLCGIHKRLAEERLVRKYFYKVIMSIYIAFPHI